MAFCGRVCSFWDDLPIFLLLESELLFKFFIAVYISIRLQDRAHWLVQSCNKYCWKTEQMSISYYDTLKNPSAALVVGYILNSLRWRRRPWVIWPYLSIFSVPPSATFFLAHQPPRLSFSVLKATHSILPLDLHIDSFVFLTPFSSLPPSPFSH